MASQAAEGAENPDQDDPRIPEPQGTVHGLPYDFRRPTVARALARWWNPADPRIFTPKSFGAGWDINLYWLMHPFSYLRGRRARRQGAT